MKNLMKLLAALGVALISTGAACAADLGKSYQQPETVSAANLTGLYFTVLGGAEFGSARMGVGDATLSGLGSRGWVGETGVGYDWQPRGSQFGAGLFASAQIASTKSTLEIGGDTLKITRDWSWLAGGRVFYTPSAATLVYLGAGYTQADFSGGGDSATLAGWFAETGVETRLSGPVFGRIAGRYTEYERLGGEAFQPSSLEALVGVAIKIGGDRF